MSQRSQLLVDMGLENISPMSSDFVKDKIQFHLHHLTTEQRHQKTMNLSKLARGKSTAEVLNSLFEVDFDISTRLKTICTHESEVMSIIKIAIESITYILLKGYQNETFQKIYIYGCGATGRLAKMVESALWRPFWRKVSLLNLPDLPPSICKKFNEMLIGEMTGGDRALISSLEGLEDLQLIGKLQLQDHKIAKGDIVFAITEGGETSSVIGTILAAKEFYSDADVATKNLFFMFNNPPEDLKVLTRSRLVLEDSFISKIPLCSGPQAVTGSTRMQATTIETFVMGIILEEAIKKFLEKIYQGEQLKTIFELLGFDEMTLENKFCSFDVLRQCLLQVCPPQRDSTSLSEMTDYETFAYKNSGRVVYYADQALLTVFTDCTERSPTFSLKPLDTVHEESAKNDQCWIKVVTSAPTLEDAWISLLQRPFKGLKSSFYREWFETEIADPYLQSQALTSLSKAGDAEQLKYNFSHQTWKNQKSVEDGKYEFGVLFLLEGEQLSDESKSFLKQDGRKKLCFVLKSHLGKTKSELAEIKTVNIGCHLFKQDPLRLRQHVVLKMALNAHSTAVMAGMGRLVGNTMTNVTPSNLKLIGRATYLILLHVNQALLPFSLEIVYAEANAVLYNVIEEGKRENASGSSTSPSNGDVAIAIVQILETISKKMKQQTVVKTTYQEANAVLKESESKLEIYLEKFNLF